ncbi:glutamate 5-kinase [Brevibacillus dissolubilis]|uniref:glutamate 5-kinase n=1 Tax=Brevibacillus dissolubilis TaxID=1844116 RepID=UPI0011170315|nr:glutamate 5-kinase [Brevibacillus dissolubilis]
MSKKRVVVKVGSSSLAKDQGGCDLDKMQLIVSTIATLRDAGHEVVLVSSGAVASGYTRLGFERRPRKLAAKQAAAAVGQGLLMQNYNQLFGTYDYTVAQILLTRGDFSDQERYRHAFQTVSLLLSRGVIPIINENDTVSVSELTFSDNDMLGALVAGLVHADLYVILTDTDGFYDKHPQKYPDAKRFSTIGEITPELLALAGDAGSLGTGGMRSKLIAAQTAQQLGISTFIGRAVDEQSLMHILEGNGEGTYAHHPSHTTGEKNSVPARKQWIAIHSRVSGEIHVDAGAAEALLEKNRSLLLAGICRVIGSFDPGEVVDVYTDGKPIGRGKTRFSADELRIAIARPDGIRLSGDVINRDHWVSQPVSSYR